MAADILGLVFFVGIPVAWIGWGVYSLAPILLCRPDRPCRSCRYARRTGR